ncbi:hypothetical protein FGO68_gene4581 [Halteria grandinella]|uniref:Ribosomal protein L9 domain-containing protein n=1 Tax=Halteria grandinella TaxID=5974 RepID=A0A8J8NR77_HALGN|nr:hypothetical protein FGO68_gene4581 [Halteria grandinella]
MSHQLFIIINMLAKQLFALSQKRAAPLLLTQQSFSFTRSFRKILLLQDVENLGFQGEWAFVKPGYAFNRLVPEGRALFATDPAVEKVITDQAALKLKQEQRVLEVFLSKLKDIRIIFDRDVSEINKNVARTPVAAEEVLDSLNKRYNLGIKKQQFKMEQSLDTIGEHFVQATFSSEQFNKEFSFFVKVVIRQKKASTAEKRGKKNASANQEGDKKTAKEGK